jgi:hypothetical protein
LVREGYPPSAERVETLVLLSGYPRAAFRTLERHSRLDEHHRDDLIAVLDGLPLREEHHTILGVSALHSLDVVIQGHREVLARADRRKVKAPA